MSGDDEKDFDEYTHQHDPELEKKFAELNEGKSKKTEVINLDDLEDGLSDDSSINDFSESEILDSTENQGQDLEEDKDEDEDEFDTDFNDDFEDLPEESNDDLTQDFIAPDLNIDDSEDAFSDSNMEEINLEDTQEQAQSPLDLESSQEDDQDQDQNQEDEQDQDFSTDFNDLENDSLIDQNDDQNDNQDEDSNSELEPPSEIQEPVVPEPGDEFETSMEPVELSKEITPSDDGVSLQKIQRPKQEQSISKHENFTDVANFATSMTYGKVATTGNPAFSVIMKNIKYKEDAEHILMHLREHGLVNVSNESIYEKSLLSGSVLISQIGEYSAIYLAHKFRHLDLDIWVGLSDELHESKHYDIKSKGLVSKDNLFQNKAEFKNLDISQFSEEDVIISTLSKLEGFDVYKYQGIVTEHSVIDLDKFEDLVYSEDLDEETEQELSKMVDLDLEILKEDQVLEKYKPTLNQNYNDLMLKLRSHALKNGANAVIGISFNLTPIKLDEKSIHQYKVTCTGNAVIVIQEN